MSMAENGSNAPELTVDQALANVARGCAMAPGNLQDHQLMQASLQVLATTLRQAAEAAVPESEEVADQPNRAMRRTK
jgi:hypothetical protein